MSNRRAAALFRALLQNLLGEVVSDLGIVTQFFVVSEFKKLRMAFAQSLADALLHAGIIQFTLSSGLSRKQLVDCLPDSALGRTGAAIDRQNVCDLPRLELADRGEGRRIPLLKRRFGDKTHIPGIGTGV